MNKLRSTDNGYGPRVTLLKIVTFRVLFLATVLVVMVGCMHKKTVAPMSIVPDMPELQPLRTGDETHPVFGPTSEYVGSSLEHVGHEGLFEVHPKDSTKISLLKNGDESFSARVQILENAKTSVRIQALMFSGDESGLYIAEILKQKKAAGLDVRVIVDAVSNLGLQTQWMYFDLKQHGIEVQGYESLYLEWLNEVPIPLLSPVRDPESPNSRYHEKMWIIDGETENGVAIVGGLNIANEYFRVDPSDPGNYWRDQDIIVKGSIVNDMVTAFERNFAHFKGIKESRGVLNTDFYWDATRKVLEKTGPLPIYYSTDSELVERVNSMAKATPELKYVNARSRFFQNRARLQESYINQAYIKLFEMAEQEVIICNAYFIPSAELILAARNAARRGVRVIILTNSPDTNDLPELSMVGRSYYKSILAINGEEAVQKSGGSIQIWEWYGWHFNADHQTEGTIHAKYAVFDRRFALVGSYNLDPRSENLNSETAVVFESTGLSEELARIFYNNDLAFSRIVSPQEAEEYNEPTDALYRLRKDFGSIFEPML